MGVLDRFKVILLDMNGTFMFGQDRFGPGEDFAATYRTLGGKAVADAEVQNIVRTTYTFMASDYENPSRYDDFPQVAYVLGSLYPTLPGIERSRIEDVIAVHELGSVPDAYADHLKRLAQTHRLGLVANIWSKKDRWLRELERVGILNLIEFPVFSSDYRSIKPSPVVFNLAFTPFGVGKNEVVFVGDSLVNDIEGARAAGFSTVWINWSGTNSAAADYKVPSLRFLRV